MVSQTNKLRAQDIPFIWWSRAAALFREFAALHAPSLRSVLLLGPRGVGKKAMASAWKNAAGPSARGLEVVELNPSTKPANSITIATSTFGVPEHVTCLDLSTGQPHSFLPGSSDVLDASVVSRFSICLYMPPLRERPFDVLALIDYFNFSLLPRTVGCSK
jgi:DNA-binding NtrC family response regulator